MSIVALFEQPVAQSIVIAAAIALITLVAARLATRLVRRLLRRDDNPLPSASIVVNITRAAILLAGASILLDVCFGVSANALVTALGVGGIAVSLGFQDTLSNLIGGMQVTFMKIVQVGDNVEIGGKAGVVTDITWRHTTLKDSTNQTIIVPNSIMSSSELVHLLPTTRVAVEFHVVREADGGPRDLDLVSKRVVEAGTAAASEVVDIVGAPSAPDPSVRFLGITERGYRGGLFFYVADANKTYAAADAAIKATAPIVG